MRLKHGSSREMVQQLYFTAISWQVDQYKWSKHEPVGQGGICPGYSTLQNERRWYSSNRNSSKMTEKLKEREAGTAKTRYELVTKLDRERLDQSYK